MFILALLMWKKMILYGELIPSQLDDFFRQGIKTNSFIYCICNPKWESWHSLTYSLMKAWWDITPVKRFTWWSILLQRIFFARKSTIFHSTNEASDVNRRNYVTVKINVHEVKIHQYTALFITLISRNTWRDLSRSALTPSKVVAKNDVEDK